MRRILITIAAVLGLASGQARATSSWEPAPNTLRSFSAIGTFTSGTEGKPPAATDGANLSESYALDIVVCAAEGETLSGGDGLHVYVRDPGAPDWAITNKVIKLKIMSPAQRCASPTDDSPTLVGHPGVLRHGRIAIVPNGITASTISAAKPLTILIKSTSATGNPL